MFLEQSFVIIFKALRYVCRLAKRFATQFFIANYLLCNYLNILVGSLDGYITHLIFLHHLRQLHTLQQQETRPSILLYQMEFCTHSHFFRNFVITTKPFTNR